MNTDLIEACKLVLLFHSGSPWDFEKQQAWIRGIAAIVETSDPVVVGANGDGTWDRNASKYEATTKNLCLAVRTALTKATNASPSK